MMAVIFHNPNSFIKQTIIYLKSHEDRKARELSEEFVKAHPSSLMAHYLLAKSCYRLKDLPTALAEGHKAFNLAESEDDMVATGILLACMYYELRRYTKGHEILSLLSELGDERVEKALFIFSLCMDNPNEAMMHVDALYHINKEVANRFVDRVLELASSINTVPSPP